MSDKANHGTDAPEVSNSADTLHKIKSQFSGILLLVLLLFLIISSPIVQDWRYCTLFQTTLYTAVLISGMWSIGRNKRTLLITLALIIPAMAAKWMDQLNYDLLPRGVVATTVMLPVGFMVTMLFRFLLKARRVDSDVLCAAISNYLMIGVFWAQGYRLLEALVPGSFSFSPLIDGATSMDQFTPFYFSIVTLCSLGYGDITPISAAARMVAVLEAMAGTFYMAILIARLVAIYSYEQMK